MYYFLKQFQLYRKWKGGKWYLIRTDLAMYDFWVRPENHPRSCGARVIEEENYD
jgi:hypothetical protein